MSAPDPVMDGLFREVIGLIAGVLEEDYARVAEEAVHDITGRFCHRRRGCGTYLAWLLHNALGEAPCRACVRASASRLAEQATGKVRPVQELAA